MGEGKKKASRPIAVITVTQFTVDYKDQVTFSRLGTHLSEAIPAGGSL